MNRSAIALVAACCAANACATTSYEFGSNDRSRVQIMLREVADDVRKNYYDPRFNGLDWDARVAAAQQQIEQASSMNQALSHVAAALAALNDSHTYFLVPYRPYRLDHGWRALAVGERVLVAQVRPGSDAELKGLKPGDEILAVNGFRAARDSLWKIRYVFNVLRPETVLRLDLKDVAGQERQLEVAANVEPIIAGSRGEEIWDYVRDFETSRYLNRPRAAILNDRLAVLKLPVFAFGKESLGDLINVVKGHESLILDLRGNPGGQVKSLAMLLGFLFGRELKIGDVVEREKTERLIVRPPDGERFGGRLVVLVDSDSGSSSEVLARVVQLEKRGLVVGDRTAGAVRVSRQHPHRMGGARAIFYGASVTVADLFMADGKSLESIGVLPDQISLPEASDLRDGRDPVLAKAIESMGGQMSAEAAARLFPFEWKR
jgi:carboxyl-terminal processing protease